MVPVYVSGASVFEYPEIRIAGESVRLPGVSHEVEPLPMSVAPTTPQLVEPLTMETPLTCTLA